MAAIVGSTDAGAVFSLLRHSGVRLNDRVQATLEIESGANDPMAIFLVTALITMITNPEQSGVLAFLWMLLLQIGFGLLMGWAGGMVLAKLVRRLNLAEGLYALMIVSGGLWVFAFTNTIGGSGFLAVYLAGIIVGNQHTRATEHVWRVDGRPGVAGAGDFVRRTGFVGNAQQRLGKKRRCLGYRRIPHAGCPSACRFQRLVEIWIQCA